MNALTRIHLDIDTRVASIRENHADWLCGKGGGTGDIHRIDPAGHSRRGALQDCPESPRP